MPSKAKEPIIVRQTEMVPLETLTPHPRNYRVHPEDQIDHLMQSIKEHGFYRNIVISTDSTILAGHGITQAAARLGIDVVPVVRMNISADSPAALKILAADNYLAWFSEDDDRALTELLKEISELDSLYGTGFDEENLALLAMVTRPAHELADFDAAAEWVGMPDFTTIPGMTGDPRIQLVINFQSEAARAAYVEEQGLIITHRQGKTLTAPFPPAPREDTRSILVEG